MSMHASVWSREPSHDHLRVLIETMQREGRSEEEIVAALRDLTADDRPRRQEGRRWGRGGRRR